MVKDFLSILLWIITRSHAWQSWFQIHQDKTNVRSSCSVFTYSSSEMREKQVPVTSDSLRFFCVHSCSVCRSTYVPIYGFNQWNKEFLIFIYCCSRSSCSVCRSTYVSVYRINQWNEEFLVLICCSRSMCSVFRSAYVSVYGINQWNEEFLILICCSRSSCSVCRSAYVSVYGINQSNEGETSASNLWLPQFFSIKTLYKEFVQCNLTYIHILPIFKNFVQCMLVHFMQFYRFQVVCAIRKTHSTNS